MNRTLWIATVLLVALSSAAQDWTTPYADASDTLVVAADAIKRHSALLSADLETRGLLRSACFALIKSTDKDSLANAEQKLDTARALLHDRLEPSASLEEALDGVAHLAALVRSNPGVARDRRVLVAQRRVLRSLQLQAADEATELRLLHEQLQSMVQEMVSMQRLVVAEQFNATRTEIGIDPF